MGILGHFLFMSGLQPGALSILSPSRALNLRRFLNVDSKSPRNTCPGDWSRIWIASDEQEDPRRLGRSGLPSIDCVQPDQCQLRCGSSDHRQPGSLVVSLVHVIAIPGHWFKREEAQANETLRNVTKQDVAFERRSCQGKSPSDGPRKIRCFAANRDRRPAGRRRLPRNEGCRAKRRHRCLLRGNAASLR